MKKILLLVLAFIMLCGCTYKAKTYASLDDYPVYEGNDMELTYSPAKSDFCVWSPAAQSVVLKIYDAAQDGEPSETLPMKAAEKGTWRVSVKKELLGKFYTFQVTQDGTVYDETPGIWAKAVGVNGNRAAIIDFVKTNPDGWENDVRPKMDNFTDAIIYELHYRDFSIAENSGNKNHGKFLALTEENTVSPKGEKTGLSHLKELGITHVQILPSYDYGSIDETKLDENVYNWGYDPKNYNVPEGGYATDPYNPYSRISELKKMVQTLHQNGIRVIMDVVYNHTFVGETSPLNLLVPKYFYRFKEDGSWSDASGCGNETASERVMVRRFMVESVKYWVKEYHIDGFRFDLMGIHDIETMRAIRAALDEIDPSISIHGEGWTAAGSPLADSLRALKNNAPKFYPTAVFSDDIRDAMRGNWTEGDKGGFVTGTKGYEESIKFGIAGATAHSQVDLLKICHTNTAYSINPFQAINYVSCHDDPCLTDKLRTVLPKASEKELLAIDKLAQTIVLTSQGVPFIFAGEEIFRNKKGVHNSYNSPDSINLIDWNYKTTYRDLFDYYKNLIALRKAHPAFRMTTAKDIQDNLQFLETDKNVVAYIINNNANGDAWKNILVVFNGNRTPVSYTLPSGKWNAVCLDGKIDLKGIATKSGKINISASSAGIFWAE
ncbi:MAG: type I pullulanase [Prevotellaceae bacterium]|jgi:pullulanase|nr:type I pullulanase [Prevotellaceae bacterium]